MLRSKFNLAVIAGAALLLTTGRAHAGLVTITLTDSGGGGGTQTFNLAQGTYSFVFPSTTDYTGITGTLTTNDNAGTPALATMSLMFQAARNSANAGIQERIQIVASDSFFPGVVVPYNASHTLSGSVFNTGLAATGATTARLTSTFTGSTSTTLGPTNVNGVNIATFAQSFGPASANGTFSGAGNLTLTADLSATAGTANDVLGLSGNLQATTPEPASLALAFTGFAIAGAGAWWRRSRFKA